MKQLVCDFEDGQIAPTFSTYGGALGSLQVVDKTVIQPRSGSRCLRCRVDDTKERNTGGISGTERPSCGLAHTEATHESDDLFVGWSYHIPTEQPDAAGGRFPPIDPSDETPPHPAGMWFQIADLVLGESPRLGIGVEMNKLVIKVVGETKSTTLLRRPLILDTWHDLIIHCHISSNRSYGFIEVWHDDEQLQFASRKTAFYLSTLDKAKTVTFALGQYRCLGLGATDSYADEIRFGPTLASVKCPEPLDALAADPHKPRGELHTKGGFHFARLEDGSVNLRFALPAQPPYYPEPQTVREMALNPSDWASVVSSMSEFGENAGTYKAALAFHQGAEADSPETTQ